MKNFQILVFVLFAFLLACGDSSKKEPMFTSQGLFTKEAQLLLDSFDLAVQDFSMKVAFQRYPLQDAVQLEAALDLGYGALITLKGQGNLESVAYGVGAAIQAYESMVVVLEQDKPRLDDLFNRLKLLSLNVVTVLNSKGVKAFSSSASASLPWNLYNYNFASGITPEFTAYGGRSQWGFNMLTDVPKAQVGGANGANAWLISKPFDLCGVEQPSFRFNTMIQMDSQDATLNEAHILNTVFKVYVVLDPKPSDNFSRVEDLSKEKRLVRIFYNLDELPLGRGFHQTWAPSKDLTPFKNQKIAIAFHYDPPSGGARQYHMWQVLDFEINGVGEVFESRRKYFQQLLGNELPGGFHEVGASWVFDRELMGRKIQSDEANKKESWLLSPKFFVSKTAMSPVLKVESKIKLGSMEDMEKVEVLISENYKGGHPESADWKSLSLLDYLDVSAFENWSDLKLNLPLSEYIGKEFVVAWRYQSEEGDLHGLSVGSILIEAREGQVSPLKYNLGCLVEDPEKDKIFYDFNIVGDSKEVIKEKTKTKNETKGRVAEWKVNSLKTGACVPETFFEISGYNRSNKSKPYVGVTRKVLPSAQFNSNGSAFLRLVHRTNFYRNDIGLLRVEVAEKGTGNWVRLEFLKEEFQSISKDVTTTWSKLPGELMGKDVDISLVYEATQTSQPLWQIKKIELKLEEGITE